MDIVFATSDLYSKPAMVTITSLLMNNTSVKDIHIYYVENGVSDDNKALLVELVEKQYGRKIDFIPMPESLNQISGLLRTNAIAYSYCYFQDILPDYVEKVLLLEGDTIVVDKLDEFYDTDIDDYYLAATDDLQSEYCKEKLGLQKDSPYFNSGVMLLNLRKMRADDISNEITKVIQSGRAKFLYEVQDEMNVLFEGKFKLLPPKFNCTTAIFLFDYKDMKRYRWPSTCCTEKEFIEAREHPVVVHFTKNQIIQSRPWIKECSHPYREYYLNVKADSPAKEMPLWNSGRKISNKIVFFVFTFSCFIT